MLQSDWLSDRAASAISVQGWRMRVHKMATFSCFPEISEEDLELLLDNSIHEITPDYSRGRNKTRNKQLLSPNHWWTCAKTKLHNLHNFNFSNRAEGFRNKKRLLVVVGFTVFRHYYAGQRNISLCFSPSSWFSLTQITRHVKSISSMLISFPDQYLKLFEVFYFNIPFSWSSISSCFISAMYS